MIIDTKSDNDFSYETYHQISSLLLFIGIRRFFFLYVKILHEFFFFLQKDSFNNLIYGFLSVATKDCKFDRLGNELVSVTIYSIRKPMYITRH